MSLLKKLLNRINGLHFHQDYLCLAEGNFHQPLHVYLVSGNRVIKDITKHHSLVGYCPVVISLPLFDELLRQEEIEIVLTQKNFEINHNYDPHDILASMLLEKIPVNFTNLGFQLYTATRGAHHFIPGFYQKVLNISNERYGRKPGNVFLEGNLYRQVQIVYSVPRKISLISLGRENKFNLFPTDLHGNAGDFYLISLRHEGKACKQVLDTGRIVLHDMHVEAYKRVYGLGKNHMQDLKPLDSFDFQAARSVIFQLPLPFGGIAYKELELQDSLIKGIHRILVFRVVNEKLYGDKSATLVHIHNLYATWRRKKGIQGNYFLR